MWISCEFRRDISEKKRAMRLLSLVLYVVMVGNNRITRPLPLGLKKSKTEPPVHRSLKKSVKRFFSLWSLVSPDMDGGTVSQVYYI